jgi:hypothetical protein
MYAPEEQPEKHDSSGRQEEIPPFESLRAFVDRHDAESCILFDLVVNEIEPNLRPELLSQKSNLTSLLELFRTQKLSQYGMLLAAHLIRDLKQGQDEETRGAVDKKLFDSLSAALETPHLARCLSIALQHPTTETLRKMLPQLEENDIGDYIAVALRGTEETCLSLKLRSLLEGEDEDISLRATMVLLGSSRDFLRSTLDQVLSPEVYENSDILYKHVESHDPQLNAILRSVALTFPIHGNVLAPMDEYSLPLPLALVDSIEGTTLDLTSMALSQGMKAVDVEEEDEEALILQLSNEVHSSYDPTDLLDFDTTNLIRISLEYVERAYRAREEEREASAKRREELKRCIELSADDMRREQEAIERAERLIKMLEREDSAKVVGTINHLRSHAKGLLHPLPAFFMREDRRGEIEDLMARDLVEIIRDPQEGSIAKYFAGRLLNEMRYAGVRYPGELLDRVCLDCITGATGVETKHAASLVLRGTKCRETIDELGKLFFDSEYGDFAAMALRRTPSPQGRKVLYAGLRSRETDVFQRAVLATLNSEDRKVASLLSRRKGSLDTSKEDMKYVEAMRKFAEKRVGRYNRGARNVIVETQHNLPISPKLFFSNKEPAFLSSIGDSSSRITITRDSYRRTFSLEFPEFAVHSKARGYRDESSLVLQAYHDIEKCLQHDILGASLGRFLPSSDLHLSDDS